MRKKLLSDEQREMIKSRYTGQYGELDKLAKEYGVSRSTISRVVQSPTKTAAEREKRRQYMARRGNNSKEYYHFRIVVDPLKDPDIIEKLMELENSGIVGSRQKYVRDLIKKDIEDSNTKKDNL